MEFSYSYIKTETEQIEIEDIGNFALEATNALGYTYYLIVKTVEGFSQILSYGPIHLDFESLPSKMDVVQSWKRIDYNQKRVEKIIDQWLNDGYKGIVKAQLIDIVQACTNCRHQAEYLFNNDF